MMGDNYILSIDQGTTSTRAVIYNHKGCLLYTSDAADE